MNKFICLVALLLSGFSSQAQFKLEKPVFSGIYFQWGYNRDWYSKSDIRLRDGDKYDITIYDVVAKDKPDFSYYKDHPFDITIPQNSYRIGFYLNKKHTHAIEINYDHAKYVQVDNQTLRMKGQIGGKQVDADTNLGQYLIHVEHTNGANFYHLNYVGQTELWHGKKNDRTMATAVWKAGAGVVIPKSFIIAFYQKLDNRFKVAGYIASVEAGFRFYPLKHLFLEATGKSGFANYLDALGVGTGRVSHHFWYGEVVGLVGYDMSLNFLKRKPKTAQDLKPGTM
ncbi:MAG: hypothetical protein KDC07_07705 [Chitinophagaceae bacterium]|nr:hypothetical protein [Chitinophagaceae bacterium]MCB9045904.1 hypothetical protein [Chitinophagales bacterium]